MFIKMARFIGCGFQGTFEIKRSCNDYVLQITEQGNLFELYLSEEDVKGMSDALQYIVTREES